MKKIYSFIIVTGFIFLFIAGCKTASKQFQKGDYDEAVELAVKKLQKKSGDQEMQDLLQQAYRFAVNGHETRIRQLSGSSQELKWERIYDEYRALQKLYHAVNNSPEASRLVIATDYSSYLYTYADKAADTRYERGMQWMDKNDKQSFRNAYHEFVAALRYRPEDISLMEKREDARRLATVHVVVMPVESYRFRFSSYSENKLRNFENDLLRQLKYNTGNPFVKFYSELEARNENIQPDQYLDFRLGSLNLGTTRDENNIKEVSREVVVKETVYRPDSVVKEYKKVFAKIITTKRTRQSEGSLQIHIRDFDGHRLWIDDVRGDHCWTTEFTTFTGDERALSENDRKLVNRNRETPPDEEDFIRHILNDINSNLMSNIRSYYSRL